MVDVKLDVGGSPAFKAASKQSSGTGICRVLMYLLLICAVTFLALDAAELISLGIVKDVMGLKVMKTEEFTNMTAAYEATKTQLADKEKLLVEKEKQFTAVSWERDGLKGQVDQMTGERDNLKKESEDKQNQLNAVTGERDIFKEQVENLTLERDGLQKQIKEAKAATTKEAAGKV